MRCSWSRTGVRVGEIVDVHSIHNRGLQAPCQQCGQYEHTEGRGTDEVRAAPASIWCSTSHPWCACTCNNNVLEVY
jgi:hypothetical protein